MTLYRSSLILGISTSRKFGGGACGMAGIGTGAEISDFLIFGTSALSERVDAFRAKDRGVLGSIINSAFGDSMM